MEQESEMVAMEDAKGRQKSIFIDYIELKSKLGDCPSHFFGQHKVITWCVLTRLNSRDQGLGLKISGEG